MDNGSSSKSQAKPKKVNKSKELKEDDAVEETVKDKQVAESENLKTDAKEGKRSPGTSDKKDKNEKVPEDENPKTDAKEEKESQGTSEKKDKKEKSTGCCKRCKAKAKMMKEKLKEEEPDGKDEKQKQKTDTNEEKGSKATSDVKAEKKEKSIIAWRSKSTKKDRSHGNINSFNANPHYQTPRSMYHGGPNFSNQWNMHAPPRVMYPAFSKGPMYGQCGGGPFQPMHPAAAMSRGAMMSPYPPMAAAAMYPPPYWQGRPDANPITHYTSYRDNYTRYSYFLI